MIQSKGWGGWTEAGGLQEGSPGGCDLDAEWRVGHRVSPQGLMELGEARWARSFRRGPGRGDLFCTARRDS